MRNDTKEGNIKNMITELTNAAKEKDGQGN